MRKELKKIIDAANDDLVGELDPDHGLLRLLLAKGVFSSDQVDECQAEKTRSKKIFAMLGLLKTVEDVHFKTFCDILIELSRKDLVDRYLKCGLLLLGQTPTSGQPNEPERSTVSEFGEQSAAASASETLPADVFISHNWKIHPEVQQLCKRLQEKGIRCWLDDQQMGGGANICEEIDRAIRSCRVFLACITKEYTQSDYCKLEMNLACIHLKKKIIPLRMDDTEWPPAGLVGFIANPHLFIDFCPATGGQINWYSPKFDQLVRDITKHLNGS